ncbi:hypothetical protein [Rhizobium sullae]|jgi:hypothetical protein|uniref:Uncharacterized protein n=1 Tax=Rhizobium sullae TaxID=50338 RepID=A0A2N0D6L1_RHISU|nr:hypothetical protein [Rhizobium sullae]PKA41744.1 hypothetical protein CWR43_20560 [Rhizobium sullae]UWU13456.1 hypothetical protein N2599_15035 [Rhizobium sullae]
MTATKDAFFNATKMSARDKAEATDHTARAIIADEAKLREKKTEKLKALRLQREAEAEPELPAAKRKRKASVKSAGQ